MFTKCESLTHLAKLGIVVLEQEPFTLGENRMLPEIGLKLSGIYQDELFFAPNCELVEVLAQKNPVFLVLELPGMLTQVLVCFPKPCTTRIYAGRIRKNDLVGEVADKHQIYKAPNLVQYRYGVRLLPWMFFGWLDPETKRRRVERDNVVNYSVLNSVVGHTGVLIRVSCKHDFRERDQEYFEIYHFSTGNDYHFAERWRDDPNTRMIARFVPEKANTSQPIWRPENAPRNRVGPAVPCFV